MASIEEIYEVFLRSNGINKDSRDIAEGDLFLAIRAGNDHAEQAIQDGAIACIVDKPELEGKEGMFYVDDSIKALQQLANVHRHKLARSNPNFKVLAIAGSNGKTTTKELIHAVLSTKYKILSTPGNYNNHIGLPLTLLLVKPEHDIAVVEMGTNQNGDIDELCRIAEPDMGLITNIGKEHLEGFGSIEGVLLENAQLFEYLNSNKGLVVVPDFEDLIFDYSIGMDRLTYGNGKSSTYQFGLNNQGDSALAGIQYQDEDIKSNLAGDFNRYNIACATAIGLYFEIDVKEIKSAVGGYQPSNMRSQLIEGEGHQIMLDAYNANPSSMEVAVKGYDATIFLLGDMLEVGADEIEEHCSLIKFILKDIQTKGELVLVGPLFKQGYEQYKEQFEVSDQVHIFENHATAIDYLKPKIKEPFKMLVKGSRGMTMEIIPQQLGLI